jgi:hypothetical protein
VLTPGRHIARTRSTVPWGCIPEVSGTSPTVL